MKLRHLAAAAAICLPAACAHNHGDAPPPRVVEDEGRPPDVVEVVHRQEPPAELSESANRAIGWLLEHQMPNGAWGQGDEAPAMRGQPSSEVGSVADTCVAALALVRAGSTPRRGPHARAVERAADFVMTSIERSDEESLWVTENRGTRVQGKIGTYVDTFASLNFLNELRGEMANPAGERRLEQALGKVRRKIERNQGPDGSFGQQGWAPTLGEALAARGLNREARAGAPVSQEVLRRVERRARARFDDDSRSFAAPAAGSAGIQLYDAAGAASTLEEAADTADHKGDKQPREVSPARARAQAAAGALRERLSDPSFVQGFGSNGGEEFLSYMLISETLASAGGEDFDRWHRTIGELLTGVQNADGSFTGHHCITGRTFCTATALLVMLSDRLPVATPRET
jgi:hypothetical protein